MTVTREQIRDNDTTGIREHQVIDLGIAVQGLLTKACTLVGFNLCNEDTAVENDAVDCYLKIWDQATEPDVDVDYPDFVFLLNVGTLVVESCPQWVTNMHAPTIVDASRDNAFDVDGIKLEAGCWVIATSTKANGEAQVEPPGTNPQISGTITIREDQ